ncbi:hypothetical protein [Kordiimonas sp.]|uniref:hypothetical protein n=1 Tax=Kordiimonas sp. TaxID=1970157 RepID=UPI003B52D793
MAAVGAAAIDLLSDIAEGKPRGDVLEFDIAACIGVDVNIVIDMLVEALTPNNGDAEIIRAALNSALEEALCKHQDFDPSNIDNSALMSLFETYLTESVFHWIVVESDKAFQKTDNAEEAIRAENGLKELISVVVEEAVGGLGLGDMSNLQVDALDKLHRDVVHEVLEVWEGYDD